MSGYEFYSLNYVYVFNLILFGRILGEKTIKKLFILTSPIGG
jgi:hypothetical protein